MGVLWVARSIRFSQQLHVALIENRGSRASGGNIFEFGKSKNVFFKRGYFMAEKNRCEVLLLGKCQEQVYLVTLSQNR